MRGAPLFLGVLLSSALAHAAAPSPDWQPLAPGVDWAELALPGASGEARLSVVRVDPAKQPVELLSAAALKLPANLTAEDWARHYGLLAVTNAGMYQLDHRSPVGYARVAGEELNPKWKDSYQALLVADPVDGSLPRARLLDPACDGDVKTLAKRYRTVLQSMRMIDCHGTNVWAEQPRRWSIAAVASDTQGRLLFLHARAPYSVHDFDELLLKLPLGITRAMYLEGGPEASLHVEAKDGPRRRIGDYETGILKTRDNTAYWELPLVLAVKKPGPAKP